ncbi:MAG TPA: hypothetical protein VHC63_01310 [Acidimicrobiales bacterium]|nr:hypothetical protein [Acidimicrobiales bacterium]
MVAAMPPLLRDLHDWVNGADAHVVLVDGDEVLAFAARMRHRAHPQRDLAAVYPAGSDDASALYNAVRGRRNPLKVRIPADDTAGIAAAIATGFKERIRSATYKVAAYKFTGDTGLAVEAIEGDATREFLDALAVLYMDSHRWDPPAVLRRKYVRDAMAAGAQHMALVRDAAGEVIGVGVAHASDDPNVAADIALVGPLDQSHRDADAITRALLSHLATFYAFGDAPLWFEIDTGEGTNEALARVVTPHASPEEEVVILTSD